MEVVWTEEQQKVIDLRNRNILVSAAAGSGKTAVLVERIISRLTRENPPLDVDRLLIMTFTEAAAAEMKERIGLAIEKALEEDPQNEHLKKQSVLIRTAKIMTIHSFCNSVIREYFHTIDLDPGFRVAEEGELKLLKQEVMKEILEAHYESGETEFFQFVEHFATGKDDSSLEASILQMYEFAESYPIPKQWLQFCTMVYQNGMQEESAFVNRLTAYIRNCLRDIANDMERALEICREDGGPYMYEKTIEADKELLGPVLEANTVEEWYQAFTGMGKWDRMAANRDPQVDKELAEYVKDLRAGWKEEVDLIKEKFFFQSPEQMDEDLKACYPVMRVLVDLTQEFCEKFAEKKTERNLIDFGDMEHFAIQILTKNEDGKLVPSDVAKELQEKYDEVMVDEYQDSNLVQETILRSVSRMTRGENNIFMVGDVKQSIYRFRLSRPELFMEKFDTYSTEDGVCQRVDLHKNFRSRKEVIDFVNAVFFQIMKKEVGNVLYDQKAALHVGADYESVPGNETEVLVIDTELEEEIRGKNQLNARELEAKVIAARIHELMNAQKVWDKSLGNMRDVTYSDIVILTRSLKGWADVIVRILKEEGIPAYSESKEGYFATLEIGWMMDYLRVLDNFRQDIPLTAVLKSPFGKCTNEELAQIRTMYPNLPFHEAVLRVAGIDPGAGQVETVVPEELRVKIKAVFAQILEFRRRISYTAIHELLWEIMEETGYREMIAAMPGGEQRAANLKLLIVKAKAFEATSYKGLFHFVRYMEQMKEYQIDYGEADILGETANAVRVMSIHKSKGLEFPVVIVCGMGKGFNMQDTTGELVVHPDLGAGICEVDLERRTRTSTIVRNLIQTETQLENLGEELRVLYVALTRAKEKLILTGSLRKAGEKLAAYQERSAKADSMSFLELIHGRRYFDWLLPAVLSMSKEIPVKLEIRTFEEVVQGEIEREVMQKETIFSDKSDAAFKKLIIDQFSYRYPFEEEAHMKLKYTVSELKKSAALSGSEVETGEILVQEEKKIIPTFLREEEPLTGASRGSAYHKVLELLDFSKSYDDPALEEALEEFEKQGYLSREMKACICRKDILKFLQSDAGRRMHEAAEKGKLYKEQPFVFGIDAKELYPKTHTEELVLIQGIIDVYFEEEDALVVLDYKTDRVNEGVELVEKYQEQLKLYGRALEQITLKKVKEKIIYSFTLEEEIRLC